ncbi:16S rRNA (guanine(966)-N(2))-methyltransferase RsmD [Tessaracoccus sp. MC1865]|uniref:16S rRNA (guanine(966)-N(2))-methyltransferase RsmD n=1 Tax=Tessaracoccus sp. MC1865 TaxID=2760310 RepID=UPI001601E08F|nr:16S rRNA (guanine(966)-N(2))-methyltransferase RsmD [Tessaracoccus sp. MC1865]MBB1484355.1 16S rRNA (guanine(966)-N(2))-methyltransferase RsmD [Tessaracoccus sp. MC1865]QTO38533.1 16S rRNA (guanine(966)-N(2))-methyltransferase RsmD [Tessaracoccus sp. MC1865]
MSRIIAGRAKGRRLETPKGDNTRPTTDRTREGLFSSLVNWFDTVDHDSSQHLSGCSVLDLFAGSGAIGLEAASRGANPVVLVEADRVTAGLISANARAIRVDVDVRAAKAQTFVDGTDRSFDVVIMDPPYGVTTDEVEKLLASLARGVVAERGLVVVERSKRDRAPVWPPAFTETWEKRYGETVLYYGSVD